MDFFEAVKRRSSVREYASTPVARGDLEKIIDCARLSPTARGEEPWEFVVVTDKEKIKELGEMTDHGKFLSRGQAAVAVISKDTKYYLEDCSAATENILLGAAALGIGSCWVAGDKKGYAADIKRALSVPREYKLVSLIALGYPGGPPSSHPKRALEDTLHWERFREKT